MLLYGCLYLTVNWIKLWAVLRPQIHRNKVWHLLSVKAKLTTAETWLPTPLLLWSTCLLSYDLTLMCSRYGTVCGRSGVGEMDCGQYDCGQVDLWPMWMSPNGGPWHVSLFIQKEDIMMMIVIVKCLSLISAFCETE